MEATWGWQSLIQLHILIIVHPWGKSREEFKQEQWQEPWKNSTYWLVVRGLLNLPSCTTQDHLPKSGTKHSRLGPLASTINHENAPTDLPAGLSDGGNAWIGVCSFQVTLVCVKFTKKNPAQVLVEKLIQNVHVGLIKDLLKLFRKSDARKQKLKRQKMKKSHKK